jgi:probable F420-dependent oxidoreductase
MEGTDMEADRLSVVLGLWQDRDPLENLDVATNADRLGYGELWIGEMATFDAFALATAIGLRTNRIALTIGPLAVAVRTPTTVAMGAASVAALTGRPVGVALGTSSDVVVNEWHGRSRARSGQTLAEHAEATRLLLSGTKADVGGEVVRTSGYRLRLPPVTGPLSIAAFGPAAIRTAARVADRLVLNMLTPAAAARLREQLAAAAAEAGRPCPRVAIWLATAVDPTAETLAQMARGKVAYLAAPGYGEMFADAGFGDLVEFARTRPHPRDLLAAVPAELIGTVGLVGSTDQITDRIAAYRDAGVDDVCIVPVTAGDDAGRRTLEALAPAARSCSTAVTSNGRARPIRGAG